MLIITIPIPLQTVNIEMPSGAPPQQQETPVVVKIMVLNNGSMLWEDQVLQGQTELDAKLAATAQLQPQPEIHIGAQPQAPYALIAKALASSQRLGLEKIGIVGMEELGQTNFNVQ
jgi:biopolymer transport protein ExbD